MGSDEKHQITIIKQKELKKALCGKKHPQLK
jgi:hypothetical protein